MSLAGKTLFITGASRGIGLAIALRAARDGAQIAIAAKTERPHPKLPGTIYTAADEIERAGGKALPLVVDVRDEGSVRTAIERTVQKFGGLDVVVNNASAISLSPVAETDMRRFDLMHQVNTRGTFLVCKYAVPHLEKAANPHILMNSPPLDLREDFFAGHTAYSIAKFGMSLVVLGLAGELRTKGVAVNALCAHHHCHLGDQEPARRRRHHAHVAHPGNHGGCRLPDLPQTRRGLHRPFPHRRFIPGGKRHDRLRAIPRGRRRAFGAEHLRARPARAPAGS
jgi:NAD(P)-dependent dehydrogenase (short-subunit alcohol dehydrogenase family)